MTDLSTAIRDLIRRESELQEAAYNAARAGDVDTYIEKMKQAERVAAELRARRIQQAR